MSRFVQHGACAVIVCTLAVAVIEGADVPLTVGQTLPPLQGEDLTGRSVTLPTDSQGRHALLLLGFTYASRVPVEAWGDWFRREVGVGPTITFFEVPMIGGFARLGRWFIDRGMRKGTPRELHGNVITVFSKVGDWKARLGVTSANDKDAFLIVIDERGEIRWLHHGPFDAGLAAEVKAFFRVTP